MFNYKIKTTITTIFIIIVSIVLTVMIYFQYKYNNDFALLTTKTLLNNVAQKSINHVEAYHKSSNNFINIVQNINNIDQDIEFSQEHILLPIITNYINNTKYIYGIYLGFANKSFYIVYNVNLSKRMRKSLNAPKNAKWLVKKNKNVDDKILSVNTFLDADLNIISTNKKSTQFNPTQRPWYKNAIKSQKIIKTEPYVFDALSEPGITYAKKINNKKGVVLSIDITLSTLNDLLSSQKLVKGSSLFLYNKEGEILGYHNQLNNKKLKNINNAFPNIFIQDKNVLDINKQRYITINNIEYIKDTKEINISDSSQDYLTILSPVEVIMAPYREKILNAIFTTVLIVLFLIIPLVYIFVKLLVKPILLLTQESKKIEEDKYDKIKPVDSFMIELSELSNSFVDMAQAIEQKTKNNKKLIEIGYKISSEHNYDLLLENILLGAKELSGADEGTLYTFSEEDSTLEFKTVINTSLNTYLGGSKSQISWPALQMYNNNGEINNKNVSVVSALENKLICIDNVYKSNEFNFAGAKDFDKKNNYKTTSMLVVPMNNRDGELVGVIQLINKIKDNEIISFNNMDKTLIESMASLSAMALHNRKLVEDLEKLLYSLIESIGSALGEKSAFTGKHVDNVAELTLLIAKAVNKDKTIYKDTKFSKEELEEIKLAAWLHDIGKITTPEHVVDKSTRLETIYERFHFIEAKVEIAKRDLQIEYLENKIDKNSMNKRINLLEDDLNFIEIINRGGEFMSPQNQERLDEILTRKDVLIKNTPQKLLSENEFYNLSIKKGTLTNEERDVINNHVLISYSMLKKVRFPKRFSNVPVLAGSHHKTVDGKGYAHEDIKNLEMTIGDKILAVADIFEALSSHDRPYRGPNKLSQVAKVLISMAKDKHLDKDLVRFVLENKVYEKYVELNFSNDQKDEINLNFDDITS